MKIGIILVLVSLMVLMTGGTAAAWDREDPEVANNGKFLVGVGVDVDAPAVETHLGGRFGDGYNLYRDDVTDTGNLDFVVITTFTPDEIDLPSRFLIWKWGASSDTWYWANGPRGYNKHGVRLHIDLPDGDVYKRYHWFHLRAGAVDFNDGTWRIQIPAGTNIRELDGDKANLLKVDENGTIVNLDDLVFTYKLGGEVTVTRVE